MRAILGEFSTAQNATLVSLDIDGVLHASDAHFSAPDVSASSVRMLHEAGLFRHGELLAKVLEEHPHVVVAVHSSWRLNHDLSTLRQLLGPVGPRLQYVTPTNLEREPSIRALMSRPRLRTDQVVILDDVRTYFPTLKSRVIECDRRFGLPSGI